MIEITEEMREAFARKYEADDGTAEGGERALLSGLAAVLAIVERDYSLRPATCEAMQENDWAVICELPRGHKGKHSATVERAVDW